LETIRQYAREKLLGSGETVAVRDRHLAHFLALAEAAEPMLEESGESHWLERLATEHDNMRAALQWTEEGGEVDTALRLAGALHWFWLAHGHGTEGRRWLEAALAQGDGGPTFATALRAKA